MDENEEELELFTELMLEWPKWRAIHGNDEASFIQFLCAYAAISCAVIEFQIENLEGVFVQMRKAYKNSCKLIQEQKINAE